MLSGKRVTEVLKGGSLGHGTTVPGEFDVDLVLLSEGRYSRAISDESYSRAGWLVGVQGLGDGGCSRAGWPVGAQGLGGWWVFKGRVAGGCSRAGWPVGAQGLGGGGCSRAGWPVGAQGLGGDGCSRAGLWFTWLLKGWVVV